MTEIHSEQIADIQKSENLLIQINQVLRRLYHAQSIPVRTPQRRRIVLVSSHTFIDTAQEETFDGAPGKISDKSSAVAGMGDSGHNRHGPKRQGAAVPLSRARRWVSV